MDIIKRIESRGNRNREDAISDLRYLETLNSERAKDGFLKSWIEFEQENDKLGIDPATQDDIEYREVIVEYVALLEELNSNIQRQA